jgi:lipase maturation factor 1
MRSILLRGLGVVYLAAFGSLAVQLDGLIGSHGILPAAAYFDGVRPLFGKRLEAYWRLPTLFWINASDSALHGLCWGGVVLSVLVIAGILPGPCLALLWVFYLSLTVAGQEFLSFQWDILLLESGLLALLLTPWGWRLGRANDEPGPFAVWLFRWLVFRLMFLSGVVKLASGDAVWWSWKALDYHYQTQPLPTWTSWYMHQMPAWFHRLSIGFMFYAELIAPFFVFGPRVLRRVGFVSLVLLQLLIMATGNYGFFNLLAIVLCFSVLDDRDFQAIGAIVRNPRVRPEGEALSEPPPSIRAWSLPRRVAVGILGGILVAVTGAQTIEEVWSAVVIPAPIRMLAEAIRPLRSANSYGLFRVMTTERPEITVEGSDDGASWKPYRFRWKPCELDHRPRFATPHMPRLDWQMWFAALRGDCRNEPWFLRFELRLLEGSPEVLALLREDPFPDRPPRYLRARLSLYAFTRWGSRDWWTSQDIGLYCPPIGTPLSEPAPSGDPQIRPARSAHQTFIPWGTIGIDRSRTPVASKMALPTAGAMATIGVSPAPAGATSLRSIRTTSISGASRNRGTRYLENFGFWILPSSYAMASNSAPPSPMIIAPSTWFLR